MVTPCLSAKSHQLSTTRQVGVGSSSKQDPLGEAPGSLTKPLNHGFFSETSYQWLPGIALLWYNCAIKGASVS